MTPAEYERARRLLARRDPVLGAAIKRIGPCRMAERQQPHHLAALVRAIAGQQLSARAAATIFARVEALMPGGAISDAAHVAVIEDQMLRAAGLSAQKLGYLRPSRRRPPPPRRARHARRRSGDRAPHIGERPWPLDGGDVSDVPPAPARRAAGERSGHRHGRAAVISPAEASRRETPPQTRREVAALSLSRLMVSLANASSGEPEPRTENLEPRT